MRLLYLSGRSVAEIARRLGRDAAVISRYMKRHDLKRPEATLERQTLALDYASDLQIDALVSAQGTEEINAAAAMIVRMAGEVRRMHEARGEHANAAAEAARERRDNLDRLLGDLGAAIETKSAGLEGGRGERAAARGSMHSCATWASARASAHMQESIAFLHYSASRE